MNEVAHVKTRKTPTRLELHRLRFHRDGGRGEFLSYDDLDLAERHILSQEVFTTIYLDGRKRDPYIICAEVFASWGVMCPHPLEVRLYGGTEKKPFGSGTHRWYLCKACGCSTRNEDFFGHNDRVVGG